MKKAVIIGAGMAGCFMAVCLAKKGFNVEVFESRPDVRKVSYDSGRSFNLTLYYRGIQAMIQIGIWDEVKKIAVIAKGNVAHYGKKKIKYDSFDAQGNEILYTVHRNNLNAALLTAAEKFPNIKITFDTKCIAIDAEQKVVNLEDSARNKVFNVHADIVIGADGINSVVRSQIRENKQDMGRKEYEDWGYKEVHVSSEHAHKMNLRPLATHTWPRPDSLLIAFPNPDNSFTLMFNLPLKGVNSFEDLISVDNIKRFVSNDFPDLNPLISEIVQAFLKRPTGKFVTLYEDVWHDKNFVVLIGDAAHGVIPFYGQGMCAAFEDCLKFTELYDKYKGNWESILPQYQKSRKRNTDILARLSKENFFELRDKSRSAFYTLKDKADTLLHKIFPEFWQPPLYILIAHGNKEYHEALDKYQKQQIWSKKFGLDFVLHILSIPWSLRQRFK